MHLDFTLSLSLSVSLVCLQLDVLFSIFLCVVLKCRVGYPPTKQILKALSLWKMANLFLFYQLNYSLTSFKSSVTSSLIPHLLPPSSEPFFCCCCCCLISLLKAAKFKQSFWFTEVWPWCWDLASAWDTSGPGGGQQCQKPAPTVG